MARLRAALLAALLAAAACAPVPPRDYAQTNALERFGSAAPPRLTSLQPGATLAVRNYSAPLRSGDAVTVAWAGVASPSADSFVAWHVPANAHLSASAPVKFKLTGGKAAGELSFTLLNMRSPGRFVLYAGGLAAPVAVAASDVVEFGDYDEPTGIHLALTGAPGELRVHWTSRNTSTPAVRWGATPNALFHSAPAATATYTRQDFCPDAYVTIHGAAYRLLSHARGDGYIDPGALHAATMVGLAPGSSVWYTVGDASRPGDVAAWSEPAAAAVPPEVGADTHVEALVVADLGQAEGDGSNIDVNIRAPAEPSYFNMLPSLVTAGRMAADVAAGRGTLLLHNGDISYARGFGALWDVYFAQMAPILAHVPYMTSIGNHESNWPAHGDAFNVSNDDSGGECGVAYDARLPMPGASAGRPWYSFEFGPVHFTQMSTEHAFHPGSEQYAFLAADLAGVNRSVTPWLVFSGHRPFYIDSVNGEPLAGDTSVGGRLVAALEPLWLRHGVDLTLTGHHHTYQRTCALAGGRCVAGCADGSTPAPVHIVAGHGGAGLSPVRPLRPLIFRAVHRQHGYLRLSADATSLVVTSVASADGKPMDTVQLRKSAAYGGRAGCAARPQGLWDSPAVRVAALTAAAAAVGVAVAGGVMGAVIGARAAQRRVAAADVAAEAEADGTIVAHADTPAAERRRLLP